MGVCLAPPIIVTEFCAKGSLFDVLRAANRHPDRAAALTWGLRLRMAVDAARGCLYLHKHVPACIHRDLKAGSCSGTGEGELGEGCAVLPERCEAACACGHGTWVGWGVSFHAGMRLTTRCAAALPHPQSPNLLVDEHWRVKVCGALCPLGPFDEARIHAHLRSAVQRDSACAHGHRWLLPAGRRLQPGAAAVERRPGGRVEPGRPHQPNLVCGSRALRGGQDPLAPTRGTNGGLRALHEHWGPTGPRPHVLLAGWHPS